MAETKYGKYIITRLPDNIARIGFGSAKTEPGSTARVLYLDDDVLKGSFYVSSVWYLKARGRMDPHSHDFDEVIGFLGTNPTDPHDLGGEIEIWIDDEIHTLTKSFMVFIPKGLKHTPMIVKRLDSPIFHFSTGPLSKYGYATEGVDKPEPLTSAVRVNNSAESKYGKYIITQPRRREHLKDIEFNPRPLPTDVKTRVVCLNDQILKGGFYMGCSWIWKGADTGPDAHVHDFDEVMGFFGTNMQDPSDLCGELEFWINGEKHLINKSCLIFVPKGLKHCPLVFRRADRPVCHMFVTNAGDYGGVKA